MPAAASRAEWADALRAVACLMVVGIHVCGLVSLDFKLVDLAASVTTSNLHGDTATCAIAL